MEAEAVIAILKHIELKEWSWVCSGDVNYEIGKIIDKERKWRLQTMIRQASWFVPVNNNTYIRAKEIQQFGIKVYDALHIACAEIGKANVLLSTDDKLLKAAKRNFNVINIEIENPLIWLQKMI
jgi:predicted nucleic acid-binding protein